MPFLEGAARGTTAMVLSNIYHLCGTLDVLGNAKMYVNGSLVGTDTVNMTSWLGVPASNDDLTDSGRTLRDYFEIGGMFLDGAHRAVTNCGSSRIDNVRFYTAVLTPQEVDIKAAEINFT